MAVDKAAAEQPNTAAEEPFEKNLERLEEIVRSLEQGSIPLEQSLALFEEGVRIARLCARRLDEVEGKIEVLLRLGEDGPLTAPFDPEAAGKERSTHDA